MYYNIYDSNKHSQIVRFLYKYQNITIFFSKRSRDFTLSGLVTENLTN